MDVEPFDVERAAPAAATNDDADVEAAVAAAVRLERLPDESPAEDDGCRPFSMSSESSMAAVSSDSSMRS